MYPPRVKMTVMMRSVDHIFKLPIKIKGCSGDNRLDIELAFPLSGSGETSYMQLMTAIMTLCYQLDIPHLSHFSSSSSVSSGTVVAIGMLKYDNYG